MVYFRYLTHFNHTNIIKYGNRPFSKLIQDSSETEPDTELMNQTLISNWNSKIGKDDKVFHLGDFAFGNKNKIKDIIPQLNGYKILVMGNHDKRNKPQFYLDSGFREVYRFPIIYQQWYILSHEPVFMNSSMPYINIHGHTHNTLLSTTNAKGQNGYRNVCVEQLNYFPITFEELLKREK